MPGLNLHTDLLFSSEEQRKDEKKERVEIISTDALHDFPNHPFRVIDDEAMRELALSIRDNGLLHPILVRERKEGGYEIIAGHRRRHACVMSGMNEIPCIVKNMSDEDAVIVMCDSNIQRENVLPSEKAFAYKMKNNALKKRGKRQPIYNSLNSQVANLTANAISLDGDSKDTVFRLIRLTELIPGLLDMVDAGKIALIPAVELSYISIDLQNIVLDVMTEHKVVPSLAQARQIKQRDKENTLTEDAIKCILCLAKSSKKESLSFKADEINDYFPTDCTNKADREKYVIQALQYYRTRNTGNALKTRYRANMKAGRHKRERGV